MAINLDCPRCHTSLQIPDRLAGGYINCPSCKGRLWVDKDAPRDSSQIEEIGIASGGNGAVQMAPLNSRLSVTVADPPIATAPGTTIALPLMVTPPLILPSNGDSRAELTTASSAIVPAIAVTPPTSIRRKKVARFVTTDTVDSMLRLAPDGKIQELHLDERTAKEKAAATSKSVSPLVLVGALSIGIVLSVVLVAMDLESPSGAGTKQKAQMRQLIRDEYFNPPDVKNGTPEPYQILLREAQRAYHRGDYKTERRQYRKVLNMLHVEHNPEENSVSGNRTRDKTLEEALTVLLSGG